MVVHAGGDGGVGGGGGGCDRGWGEGVLVQRRRA